MTFFLIVLGIVVTIAALCRCRHRAMYRERRDGILMWVCECGHTEPVIQRSQEERDKIGDSGKIRWSKARLKADVPAEQNATTDGQTDSSPRVVGDVPRVSGRQDSVPDARHGVRGRRADDDPGQGGSGVSRRTVSLRRVR